MASPIRAHRDGLVLPFSLTHLRIDFRVAEQIRLIIKRVTRAAGRVETAFLLAGDPPTPELPGRVTDVQPLDSTSTMGDVQVEPEATLKAHQLLSRRHPAGAARLLGIAHSHPGAGKPSRSGTDQRWHSDCLDLYWGEDLMVPVEEPRRRGGGNGSSPLRLQVFYSVIFPSTGCFEDATAYLLTRPEGCDASSDRELEIRHVCSETVEARRAVAGLLPAFRWQSLFRLSLTYGRSTRQTRKIAAAPAGSSASGGAE